MHRPSDLTAFLQGLGIQPKKGLSQNFLIDGNIIQKIVASSGLTKNDLVIEIGPGPGALTQELLKKGARLIAIEKDRTLAKELLRFQSTFPSLQVLQKDALEVDYDTLIPPNRKALVIANLPYQITTEIISKLVPHNDLFERLTLMVQKEVAERFTAKQSGFMNIFLQFYSEPKLLFEVSRNCFYPKPNVESAILQLKLKKPPSISDQDQFFKLVQTAFHQKRKMLRASLSSLYRKDHIDDAVNGVKGRTTVRPEELSLQEWLLLYERLSTNPLKTEPPESG